MLRGLWTFSQTVMVQFWAIPTHPIPGSRREERSTSLSMSTAQELGPEVTPQLPSFLTRQAQRPQLLLQGHAFQPLTSSAASPSMSFSSSGAQGCTWVSRWGRTGAELRGTTISLHHHLVPAELLPASTPGLRTESIIAIDAPMQEVNEENKCKCSVGNSGNRSLG